MKRHLTLVMAACVCILGVTTLYVISTEDQADGWWFLGGAAVALVVLAPIMYVVNRKQ